MSQIKLLVLIFSAALLSACTQEGKVKTAVQQHATHEFEADLVKAIGGQPKQKVLQELVSFLKNNFQVHVDTVEVAGSEAKGQVTIHTFEREDLGGLLFVFGLAAPKIEKEGLDMKKAWEKVREGNSRAPASMDELPKKDYKYEYVAKLDGDWKITSYKEQKIEKKTLKK